MSLGTKHLWSHKCPKKWDQYTLIALVITIIVLLILAGVAIATLTGDNGLLTKTGDARNTTQDAEIEEEIRVAWNKVYMDSYLDSTTNKANALKTELEKNGYTVEDVSANGNKITIKNYRGKDKVLDVSTGTVSEPLTVAKAKSAGTVFSDDNTSLPDKDGNTVVIPKGFKISSDSAEVVTEGIVIEDATYTDTKGSEFVWIPVSKDSTDANKVKGAKGNKTITLSRYTYNTNGVPTDQGANTLDHYYTEKAGRFLGEAVAKNAKNIEDFKTKTKAAGGFWIGRYEARVENWTGDVVTNNSNEEKSWTGYTNGKLVEKPGAQVFNYITQNKASELSQKMYEKENDGTTAITKFESDLINSYAWDTATLFLQEYDNRTYNINTNSNYKAKYSRQIRLSKGLKNTGTNASSITDANKDKICNVYDMADNCFEWSTETSSNSDRPCVIRGGNYNSSISYTSSRSNYSTTRANDFTSFRPVLYIK